MRLDKAVSLYQKQIAPVIITLGGGSDKDSGKTEGGVGRDYLLAKGVPYNKIIAETYSIDTEQQVQRLAAIAEKMHLAHVVVVSDGTHLFRIAQEAVSNAIKHGQATRILVQLKERHNRVSVMVTDNGSGLSKEISKSKGMGLRIMQSRAGMIGGKLTVENNRNGGACVVCSIALKTPGEQKENLRGRTKEKSKH